MSTAWMPMPGQTWPGAAASFLGMWVAMMVPMMLPSLASVLWRYRRAVGTSGEMRRDLLTALVGVGYFFVWSVVGVAAFALAVALARAGSVAAATVVVLAGALQLSAWKSRQLACCRRAPGPGRRPTDAATAWRTGLRLGLRCSACCAGPMAVLLVVGMMDLRAMLAVTAAISAERLLPAGERVATAIGVFVVGTGLFLVVRGAVAAAAC